MMRALGVVTVLVWLAATGFAAEATPYPHAELLVEPGDLVNRAAGVVLLDVRPKSAFAEGHPPRAVSVEGEVWSKAFGEGRDREGWSRRIGELGIGAESRVVVFDDNLSRDAARVWWILRYWGCERVQLLNGGWKGWQAAGGAVTTTVVAPSPTMFAARPVTERFSTKGELLSSLKTGSLQIVDARSTGEFCGTEKLKNKRGGAVPGARHLEWSDLLDKTTQRFKSAEELTALFKSAGIDPARPSVTYCQSGGRASVMAFALELMGGQPARNYYASWSEWGNLEDTPVEAGVKR